MNLMFCMDYLNKYTMYFSHPRSWVMWAMIDLHDYLSFYLMVIISLIVVFIGHILLEHQSFNDKSVADKRSYLFAHVHESMDSFHHAPMLEFIWTLLPGIISIFMAYPSFKLLYAIDVMLDPQVTVTMYGNQWYWTYEYSDFNIISDLLLQMDNKDILSMLKELPVEEDLSDVDDMLLDIMLKSFNHDEFMFYLAKFLSRVDDFKISYDSIILSDEDLPFGYPRLLAVDQVLILPSDVIVSLLITSNDVIHSWALPSHGMKMDAVPGSINQVSFNSPFLGTNWGQRSESCGMNHGFMPMEVSVLSLEDFYSFMKLNISMKHDKFLPMITDYMKNYKISLIRSFKSN